MNYGHELGFVRNTKSEYVNDFSEVQRRATHLTIGMPIVT
jgi:hypothetical protein